VLEALIRAGGGRLSGVRYSVGYDADPIIGNSWPERDAVERVQAHHGRVLD
jgi:hypothetical protein